MMLCIFLDYYSCKDYYDNGVSKSGYFYINRNDSVIEEYCYFEAIEYETCEDYNINGYNISGNYYVYVDGFLFEVYCEFEAGNQIIKYF